MLVSNEVWEQIEQGFLMGKSCVQLQRDFGVDRKLISKILKEKGHYVGRNYDSRKLEEAAKMYHEGMTLTDISLALCINRGQLAKNLSRMGIRELVPAKFHKTTETDYLVEKYREGASISQLASEINRSTNYIYTILNHYNAVVKIRLSKKYYFDETLFDNIDTESKAYWLGFLYADGCVDCQHSKPKRVELTLSKKDKSHLKKFADFINSQPPLKITDKLVNAFGKTFEACRVIVNSQYLANALVKKGCIPKKSLILAFPDWLKEPFLHHFMRGYFDGNGHISVSTDSRGVQNWRYGITGCEKFCSQYDQVLIANKAVYGKVNIQKAGQAVSIVRGGIRQASMYFSFLYKDATVYLDRKYLKINAVLG